MANRDTAQIYGLIDPRDRRIHYVGSSLDAFVRLDAHILDDDDTKKTRWIADLKSVGMQPELTILSVVPIKDRFKDEYKWIYLGKVSGWPLTNTVAMKSEKYKDLAISADSILVVEVDKGLTWRKVKKSAIETWVDQHKWLMLSFYTSIVGTLLFVAGALLTVYGGREWRDISVWLLSVTVVVYAPFAMRRFAQIIVEIAHIFGRIFKSAREEYGKHSIGINESVW